MSKQSQSSESSQDQEPLELKMENIYTEWTLQDDQLLYKHYQSLPSSSSSLPKLASLLGRGLRGVEARIQKLKDVDSFAYQRLFVDQHATTTNKYSDKDNGKNNNNNNKSLVPAKEVLRRIQWDTSLTPSDFTVSYYDRVERSIQSCPFDAPNHSVSGKEEYFVLAIPEHRIENFYYRERLVWDKEQRLDLVFGSGCTATATTAIPSTTDGGDGRTADVIIGTETTIQEVIQTYSEWKQQKDEIEAFDKKRQIELGKQIRGVLGEELFGSLKNMSQKLQLLAAEERGGPSNLSDGEIVKYVENALRLFRSSSFSPSSPTSPIFRDTATNVHVDDDINDVEETSRHHSSEVEDLEMFSNLVALLPDEELRERILIQIHKMRSSSTNSNNKTTMTRQQQKQQQQRQLPELDEQDLTEKFIRGSGAGGQKINKTANKVLLLHKPTNIRVECQDTRSLTQNRNIARKKMKLKLDEYWNGGESKVRRKVEKVKKNKKRSKARNKARQKKKKMIKDEKEGVAMINEEDQ